MVVYVGKSKAKLLMLLAKTYGYGIAGTTMLSCLYKSYQFTYNRLLASFNMLKGGYGGRVRVVIYIYTYMMKSNKT